MCVYGARTLSTRQLPFFGNAGVEALKFPFRLFCGVMHNGNADVVVVVAQFSEQRKLRTRSDMVIYGMFGHAVCSPYVPHATCAVRLSAGDHE